MLRKDREITDINQIYEFLDQQKVCRLSMIYEDYPYTVPLHYAYMKEPLTFYIHCAARGQKLDALLQNDHVCLEIDRYDGLTDAQDQACQYSSYYMSFIGTGKAHIEKDLHIKKQAFVLLMKQMTGQDDFAYNELMIKNTTMIAIEITDFHVKSHH